MSLGLVEEQRFKEQLNNSCNFSKKLQSCPNDVISFNGNYKNYCVCIVDAVNSTHITAHLSKVQACKYYGIFLNGMAMIAKEHEATVVKNIGDSLLFYFPKTDSWEEPELAKAFECASTMIECSSIINEKLHQEGLPSVQYRISADYGNVMLAKSVISSCNDIFGPTVNICSKINRSAKPNGMVIGNDLYQVVKKLKGYSFTAVPSFSVGFRAQYPVYQVNNLKAMKEMLKRTIVSAKV